MASTYGGIVAHVSSASATSESVSITEKIVEGNEYSKIESIFVGSEHQSPPQKSQVISMINVCILIFMKFVTIMILCH